MIYYDQCYAVTLSMLHCNVDGTNRTLLTNMSLAQRRELCERNTQNQT